MNIFEQVSQSPSTVKKKRYDVSLSLGLLCFLALYLCRSYSYLLFHSLAEAFSIIVACGVFMLAWNARRFLDNACLLFIGIAYLFVGGLDLLHTLSYKGMGVFQGFGTNLPTQLWISSRYIESASLLAAPFFVEKKLQPGWVFGIYGAVFSLILASIFYWDVFPVCFVEGVGLTPFKKISEYVISAMLVLAVVYFIRKRAAFDTNVLKLIVASIILTVLSELAFTLYIHAYDVSNLIGHYLKIVSFFLVYKAIIKTGLTQPYAVVFRNLKKGEEALRESEEKYRSMMEGMLDPVYICGPDKRITYMNPAMTERVGANLVGELCHKVIHDQDEECLGCVFEKVQGGERLETTVVSPLDGKHFLASHTPLRHEDGTISKMTIFHDVTDQKRAEADILYRLEFENLISDISSQFTGAESDAIDATIEMSLQKIGDFVQANTGYVFQFSEDRSWFSMTHLWGDAQTKTTKNKLQRLDVLTMPWWMEQLLGGQPVVVSSVKDLPPQASTEREILQKQQIQSLVDMPMVYLGMTIGFVGFSCLDHERIWSSDEIALFRMVSQVFTNALERKRADEALQESRLVLEQRVAERTAELTLKNEELQREIQERRTAQRDLRQSRERHEKLWNEAPAAYHTLDLNGVITRVNQTEATMLGYQKKEMIGRPIFDFIKPDQREEAKDRFREKLTGQVVEKHDNRVYVTKQGREVCVSIDDILERDPTGVVTGVRSTMTDITDRKRAEEALRDSEQELRRLSARLMHIQEDERKRIARELHDSIGQSLAATKFVVENALDQVRKGETDLSLSTLESLVPLTQQAGDEVRRIHTDLRPSLLDDLGVMSTVSWFCREFEKLYPAIRIEKMLEIEEGEIPEFLKIVIFRVLQEALNNVAKYVQTGSAIVTLRRKDGTIELSVEDNGDGFDLDKAYVKRGLSGGFGLTNMKERTELAGGTFTIRSVKGSGTMVRAAWPTKLG